MKNTGIVRRIDHLGRIAIPVELRELLQIEKKAPIEIFMEDEFILLKPSLAPGACLITGEISTENREYVRGITLSPRGAEILLDELKS
ncbi:hypothetical protein ACSFXN_18160 [Planococcus sp. 1R117A]|uniref:hypothetical protein n=1 Tax=Planococcus sp. 1R117A TaxID=3447020 RepID=UPI003EDBA9F5